MINFYLPDFFYKYNLNMAFINYMENYPERFYKDICIKSLYGSFPNAYWNGGRTMHGLVDITNIQNTIDSVNSMDIAVRFTFTNELIDEYLIHDLFCNKIMEIANNGMNEVIVNSQILEDYLRNKYPNFKYISSTTKCILDIDEFNQELDKYYLTVMDYRKNADKEFHKLIKDKDKVELLINAYCSPKCTKRREHYKILSQSQLTYEISDFYCDIKAETFQDSLKWNSVIKVNNLYDYYVNQGFKHFKIEGRTLHDIDIIDSYVYYMVLPEYRDITRNQIIKQLWL